MKLENLLSRYNINEEELNTIVVCMMEGKSLFDTEKQFEGKLSAEQLFAIGKFYCEMEFNIPVDEMAPQWALDRLDIIEENKDQIIIKIEEAKKLKKIKAIEEDMMYLSLELKAAN